MSIELISIGSSSSGNSYIILAGGKTILLDVGLTAKKIIGALEHFDIEPAEVDAVLVTHEHVDHVKSVRAIGRKCCNALFYSSLGTYNGTPNFCHVPDERVRIIEAGDDFALDEVSLHVFPLSHDAREPVGYTIATGGEKLAIVTDTGIITEDIYEAISDADKLVFESNHDEHLLMYGEYPYYVKKRIKSDLGHLSNDYAAGVLARILEEKRRKTDEARVPSILLAHLSDHNNLPLLARQAVEKELSDHGFERGIHYNLGIAAKETLTILK